MALIIGTDAAEVLDGTDGDDSISGLDGADTLRGGAGADVLDGGLGNDWLKGDSGQDTLIGGNDYDRFDLWSPHVVVIELPINGIDEVFLYFATDDYTLPDNVENLTADDSFAIRGPAHTLYGNGLDNDIKGGRFAVVDGGAGNDTLAAGAYDQATLRGGDGDDRLHAGSGAALLQGQSGDDTLYGGYANDTLSGGVGFDELRGYFGDDTYLIDDLDDAVIEFPYQGDDRLVVSVHGAKLQLDNIEQVVYINDAAPLAYWVDALTSGYSWQPIGAAATVTFAFLTRSTDPTFREFSPEDQETARRALSLWSEQTNLTLVEAPTGSAQIVFGFGDLTDIQAAGVTEYLEQRATITVDLEASGGPLQTDSWWFHVLVHEIGHGLWLKHPGNYNGVDGQGEPPFLSAAEDNTSNSQLSYLKDEATWQPAVDITLRPFDVAAAQWLYGVNPAVNAGNTVYRYSSLAWPGSLIADGGGIDTMDASDVAPSGGGLPADMTLDLRPGMRSFAGADKALITAAGQVSINYGSVIENAIGSAGRDDIFGNGADNSLGGGAGNDSLHGSAGSDTLDGGTGNDWLDGGAGADQLLGGDGDDSLLDTLGANNLLDGGNGDDSFTLTLAGVLGSGALSTVRGGAGDDTLAVQIDPATLTIGAVQAMIELTQAFSGSHLAPGLGIQLETIEHLAWVDMVGQAMGNLAPVGATSSLSLDEDVVTSAHLPMAVDFEGDALRYEVVASPEHGQLVLNADGRFVYTPRAEYSGADSFTYRVSDGSSSTQPLVVPISVLRVDDPPMVVVHNPDSQLLLGQSLSYRFDSGSLTDIDTPRLVYAVTQASGTALPAWLHFDPSNLTLTGTPGAGDAAVLRLKLFVVGDATQTADEVVLAILTSPNSNPLTSYAEASVLEDQVLIGQLPAATDPEGSAVNFEWSRQPLNGRVEISPDGHFRFVPDHDFSGQAVIGYRVNDGLGGSTYQDFGVTVLPVDDPATGSVTMQQVGNWEVGNIVWIYGNVSDPDGIANSSWRYSLLRDGIVVSRSEYGSVRPWFDDIGATLTVRVEVADLLGNVSSFVSTPLPPLAQLTRVTGTAGADELMAAAFAGNAVSGLGGNDTLIGQWGADSLAGGDGDDMLIGGGGADLLDGGAGNDSLRVRWTFDMTSLYPLRLIGGAGADMLLLEIPSLNFGVLQARELAELRAHPEGVHHMVAAAIDVSDIESLHFIDASGLEIANFAPFAPLPTEARFTVDEDRSVNGQLPQGVDIEGSPLTYQLLDGISQPVGQLELRADGSFQYTPPVNYSGDVSFGYTVNDGTTSSGWTTALIRVAAVNDAPYLVAAAADRSARPGQAWSMVFDAGLFADVEHDSLSWSVSLASGEPLPAWLSFDAAARRLGGTPTAADAAVLKLRVSASDGALIASDQFILGVSSSTNHDPTPAALAVTGDEDTLLRGALPTAIDADGDPVTLDWATNPSHGLLTLNADGSFVYAPAANFNGNDSFTYFASDGRGGSGTGTVNLTVVPVNDAPVGSLAIDAAPMLNSSVIAQLRLADVDGVGELSFAWYRDGQPFVSIYGQGYVTSLVDYGKTLSASVSYTDLNGTRETVYSNVSLPVGGSNYIAGSNDNDTIVGTSVPDHVLAWYGNDVITGGALNDTLDGGDGIDTVVYDGVRALSTPTRTETGWLVSSPSEGRDTLIDVERLRFGDTSVALDLDGAAGSVAKTIGGVFGKGLVANRDFVGIGLQLMDGGMAYADLVALAIGTDLFKQLAGATNGVVTNTQFVKLVYSNVVGQLPGPSELALYVGLLDNHSYTQATLALAASEHPLNALNIDLVGLASHGIEFVPPPGG